MQTCCCTTPCRCRSSPAWKPRRGTPAAPRVATILHDIQNYHAHAAHLAPLAEEAGVRMLALYHFVPAPRNHLLEQIFRRDLPREAVFTTEGMVFELPAGGTEIHVR